MIVHAWHFMIGAMAYHKKRNKRMIPLQFQYNAWLFYFYNIIPLNYSFIYILITYSFLFIQFLCHPAHYRLSLSMSCRLFSCVTPLKQGHHRMLTFTHRYTYLYFIIYTQLCHFLNAAHTLISYLFLLTKIHRYITITPPARKILISVITKQSTSVLFSFPCLHARLLSLLACLLLIPCRCRLICAA